MKFPGRRSSQSDWSSKRGESSERTRLESLSSDVSVLSDDQSRVDQTPRAGTLGESGQ